MSNAHDVDVFLFLVLWPCLLDFGLCSIRPILASFSNELKRRGTRYFSAIELSYAARNHQLFILTSAMNLVAQRLDLEPVPKYLN